eukprot:1002987-Heterocapsa_arctica.AAC.1
MPGRSLTTGCPASTSIPPSKYSFTSPPKTYANKHRAGRGGSTVHRSNDQGRVAWTYDRSLPDRTDSLTAR